MEKEFCFGLTLGMLGGALLVANSFKARKFVKDSQEQIKSKVSDITDKKGKSENSDQE